MSERDPRTDPQPGDVVRKKYGRNWATIRIEAVLPLSEGGEPGVAWRKPASPGIIEWRALHYWKQTMKNAQVVSLATSSRCRMSDRLAITLVERARRGTA